MNTDKTLEPTPTRSAPNYLSTRGFLGCDDMHELKESFLSLGRSPLKQLKNSWHNLPKDQYIDAGFRERRYAVMDFKRSSGISVRPEEAHYQSKKYNAIFGGIPRHFSLIETSPLSIISNVAEELVTLLPEKPRHWIIKCHQFRVHSPGQPTPEEIHQDGVDYVFILLIDRHNIKGGTSRVYDLKKHELYKITLSKICDCVLINDKKVYHDVSPIFPLDPDKPSYRDVLVITFEKGAK